MPLTPSTVLTLLSTPLDQYNGWNKQSGVCCGMGGILFTIEFH